MTIRAHRLVSAGALALAAVAAPLAIALTGAASETVAAPCLSWIGNKDDNVCAGYSNGNGVNLGTPGGIYGPSTGQPGGYNGGVVAGPLLPGQTWYSSN